MHLFIYFYYLSLIFLLCSYPFIFPSFHPYISHLSIHPPIPFPLPPSSIQLSVHPSNLLSSIQPTIHSSISSLHYHLSIHASLIHPSSICLLICFLSILIHPSFSQQTIVSPTGGTGQGGGRGCQTRGRQGGTSHRLPPEVPPPDWGWGCQGCSSHHYSQPQLWLW